MMRSCLNSLTLGSIISAVHARGGSSSAAGTKWNLRDFENLITFGDRFEAIYFSLQTAYSAKICLSSYSYTDEGRLAYFYDHNGNPVPIGTILPPAPFESASGVTWDRWVATHTNATLFDYATGGAVCSNDIVKKYFPGIATPIPDVLGSEIPSFIGDAKYINSSTGTNTVYGHNRLPYNSVYALWIGTNDLGSGSFLTDSTFAGTSIVNYTSCVFEVFDALYAAGGRNFILMNTAPLQLSPEYGILDGVGPNGYWQDKVCALHCCI
jgi:phospholipase/lecithinase/hemolysin